MARAREPTFSECLLIVLLIALIHTIAANDVAPVSYEEGSNHGVVVDTHLVRERRQVQGVTSTTPTTTTTTTTTAAPGNATGATGTPGNGTTSNEAVVTNAPSTAVPTPAPAVINTTQSPMTTTTSPVPSTTATVIENDVKYYTISTIQQPEATVKYWTQLSDAAEAHLTLSDGHRLAQTLPLRFVFRFYGHAIKNITVATGGFLYTSPFLHKFLTATQYIAPLMANFDTSLGNESHIRYQSTADQFIVRWENVHLKDQVEFGRFNFQVHLKKSGDIAFVYRNVPVSVSKIEEDNHPVKVGLSDAFYIDKDDKKLGMKRRTIYEYHRVQINVTQVTNNTLVILKPKPTCNTAQTCERCLNSLSMMGCRWCGIVQRCSDGIDWHRQDWLDKGCKYLSSGEYCQVVSPIISTKATATATLSSASTTTTAHAKSALLSSRPVSVSSRPPTVTKTPVSLSSASSSVTKTPTSVSPTMTTPVSPSSKSFSAPKTPTSLSSMTKTPVSQSSVTICTFGKSGNGNCSEIVNVQPTKAPHTSKGDGIGFPPGAVIAIIIIVALVIGIGGWLFYAYRNPTSPSGMWLMEHRPDAMKTKLAKMKFWKQSTPTGDKYAVESEA